ncbi:hypothetical protein B9Z65_5352 [Elsinoe australis]|uniref:Tyrosine specific protein phosphatases domain-containing protein n=1 Tax=Elsinoe australis TaxID=40998 RepID=A0A2P7ZDT6_9PEZI|nr:hypothetical protein B9Z65_5352 [Elsinoe australis]
MEIVPYRGGVAIVGTALYDMYYQFTVNDTPDQLPFPLHITLLTKAEYVVCGKPALPKISPDDLDIGYLHALGLGQRPERRPEVKWIVVVWYHVDRWRKALGLPVAQLHISITPANDHNLDKGITSLVDKNVAWQQCSEETLDHVLLSTPTPLHAAIAQTMAIRFPSSYKAYVRLGDVSKQDNPKLAMMAYVRALYLNPGLQIYIQKQLVRFNGHVGWGPTITDIERQSIPKDLRAHLIGPHIFTSVDFLSNAIWTAAVQVPRGQPWLGDYRLPRFFSWIIPNRLAAMSTPRNESDVDQLQQLGINTVLTLTKEEPLPARWFEFKKINNIFLPVENYKPPSLAEMDYIYNQFTEKEDKTWLIHCGGGKGRAGTVLACILAMHSPAGEDSTSRPTLDKSTAITTIRTLRPGSIETSAQETFIGSWIQHRWKLSQTPSSPLEPTTPLVLTTNPSLPPLLTTSLHQTTHLVLTGLPGSGKSTLASAITKRRQARNLRTIVINQDTTRSLSSCELAFSRPPCPGTLLVLDRCNPSVKERKRFLSLLQAPLASPSDPEEKPVVTAVHMSAPEEVCTSRIAARVGHPTIRAGAGTNALAQMGKAMEAPRVEEGFDAVLTAGSFEAAREAAVLLGGEVGIVKFPRTPHLLDLGAVGEDDVLLDQSHGLGRGQGQGRGRGMGGMKVPEGGRLVIEEKVDGANMGVSFDSKGKVRVQNRSHWVCAGDGAQWKGLQAWVDKYLEALRGLLLRDEEMWERFVLYGEWCVARHSIHYTDLPGQFVAFDLFDRVQGSFVAREVLGRALEGSGIEQVPLVMVAEAGKEVDWKALMGTRSRFYEGPVEGVYVRVEDRERRRTVWRGKVVRGDFLSGDKHWSKQEIVYNGFARKEEWT